MPVLEAVGEPETEPGFGIEQVAVAVVGAGVENMLALAVGVVHKPEAAVDKGSNFDKLVDMGRNQDTAGSIVADIIVRG